MGSPFDNTPAVKSPSRYAALNMHGEQFTGLFTQANPYRDAAVSYLTSKYYGGSRIDKIIDGLNREITQKLTDKRRAGSTVYNANSFPGINSLYSWKYIQNSAEVVRVLADGADGTIYDATAGQKSTLFTKSAGAGPARFLGINTELFIADGVDTKKIVKSDKTWAATKTFSAGQFIVDTNGNLQVAFGAAARSITSSTVTDHIFPVGAFATESDVTFQISGTMPFARNEPITFFNLSGASAKILNGQTLLAGFDISNNLRVIIPHVATQTATPESGEVYSNGDSALTGVTGGSAPAWAMGLNAPTTDGTVLWINKGSATQNWGMVAPTVAPTVVQIPTVNPDARWAANMFYFTQQVMLNPGATLLILLFSGGVTAASAPTFSTTVGHGTTDNTAFWETIYNGGTPGNAWPAATPVAAGDYTTALVAGTSYVMRAVQGGTTGATTPLWNPLLGTLTNDGTAVVWQNMGVLLNYSSLPVSQAISTAQTILDSNGYAQNLQVSGTSGGAEPTWDESSTGNVTTDNTVMWVNGGPISPVAGATCTYAYSWGSSVTKSFTNASPPSPPILRRADSDVVIYGDGPTDPQDDIVRIWRTAEGKTTLIFDGNVPILGLGMMWAFLDTLPSDEDLVAQIAAPVAQQNDPPPSNITAMAFHLKRLWGIVDNIVVWSGGPDTLVGAPYETFPPENEIPFPAQPIYLLPVTVQGGGVLVFTTSGVYIILGTGTASDPFYSTSYYPSVNLAGYNAIDVYNTAVFLMEANGKVSSLAIEYPFNPQAGYTEVGFPIGDQFKTVTTGGINSALYNPATAYVSWNLQSSADTNMFVSDGAVGWFSMNLINPPESGILWNPRAAIAGGTSAVQSIETSPGVHQLLIGPPVGTPGPILTRDGTGTVFADNGTAYPAWDAKGVILLCTTGEWVEVAHISAKSMPVGARPAVSTLMGEIQATANHTWNGLKLDDKSNDPPETPKSESVFSDRYPLAQNGIANTGDCISVKFDYGSQAVADELLDWGIFATVMNEREEQVPAQ